MRIRRFSTFIASAALLLAAGAGCGAGAGTPPSLLPVKGKVTYKGQPLTRGVVWFEPEGYGRAASGKLQPDGTFVLATLNADGVVAGFHKVFITDTDKSLAKDRAFRKYTQSANSGLTAEVSPEKTEFTFELK
jgi:hypothetical protein